MFKYPDQQKVWATRPWEQFLSGNSSNPAGRIERWQLRGAMEVESNVEILRRVVKSRKPTETGAMIFDTCTKSEKIIHVIGWRMSGGGDTGVARPGFSSFENDCPAPNEATIYVNLDLCLQVIDPNADKNLDQILNGYIIILHEMGHAVQWLKWGTAKFDSRVGKNPKRSQRLSDATSVIRDEIMKANPTMKYRDQRSLIETAVRNRVGHADYYGNKFPNDIELKNWLEHEGPICDDWGIARRISYTGIREVW